MDWSVVRGVRDDWDRVDDGWKRRDKKRWERRRKYSEHVEVRVGCFCGFREHVFVRAFVRGEACRKRGVLAPAGSGKAGGSNAASNATPSSTTAMTTTKSDVTPGTTPQKGSGHGNKNDHFLKSPPTKESMNASMMMTTPPKKIKATRKIRARTRTALSSNNNVSEISSPVRARVRYFRYPRPR